MEQDLIDQVNWMCEKFFNEDDEVFAEELLNEILMWMEPGVTFSGTPVGQLMLNI